MARYEEHIKTITYRYYMSQSIKLLGEGKTLQASYIDIVSGKWQAQEEKSGDEIAAEVITKAGLVIEG